MVSVFISHSTRDAADIRVLESRLSAAGWDVIRAPSIDHGLTPGLPWMRELGERLQTADFVIFWVTQAWEKSPACFAELMHCRWLEKPRFLPVVWRGASNRLFAAETYWPGDTKKKRFADKVALHIERRLRGVVTTPALGQVYPGLEAFRPDQWSLYFGRGVEIDDLAAAASRYVVDTRKDENRHFIFVTGGSGAGKSSFLRAGLFPELSKRFEPDTDAIETGSRGRPIVLANFAWELDPPATIAGLGIAFAESIGRPPPDGSDESWEELVAALGAQTLKNPHWYGRARAVVLLDSFEHWLTDNNLPHLAKIALLVKEARVNVVASLRSEFIPRVERVVHVSREARFVHLSAFNDVQLRTAITAPAELAGAKLDENLIATLSSYYESGEGLLPIVALVLNRAALAAEAARSRTVSEALLAKSLDTQASGVALVDAVVAALCDAADKAITENEKPELRAILFEMAELSLVSDAVTFRDVPLETATAERLSLVQKLTKSYTRVFVTRGDERVQYVRLVHDSIARIWPTAAVAVEALRESLTTKAIVAERLGRLLPADAVSLLNVENFAAEELERWRELLADWGHSLPIEMQTFIKLVLDRRERVFGEQDRRQRELAVLYRHRGFYLSLLSERDQAREDYAHALLLLQSEFSPRNRDPYKLVVTQALRCLFSMRLFDRAVVPGAGDAGRLRAIDVCEPDAENAIVSVVRDRERYMFESNGATLNEIGQVGLCGQTRYPVETFSDAGWVCLISRGAEEASSAAPIAAHFHHPILCQSVCRFELGRRIVRAGAVLSTQRGRRLLIALVTQEDVSMERFQLELYGLDVSGLGSLTGGQRFLRPDSIYDLAAQVIESVAWSGPGPRLFVGTRGQSGQGANGRILEIITENGKLQVGSQRWTMTQVHRNAVSAAKFSYRGNRLVTGGTDRRLFVHRCGGTSTDPDPIRLIAHGGEHSGHAGPVTDIELSPDETTAISTAVDGTLCLWDLSSGSLVATLRGHRRAVSSAVYFQGGRRAVSCSSEGAVILWDVGSLTPTERKLEGSDWLLCVGYLPDGSIFGVNSGGQVLRSADRLGSTISADLGRRVIRAASYTDQTRSWLIAVCEDGSILSIDPGSGRVESCPAIPQEDVAAVAVFSAGEVVVSTRSGAAYRLIPASDSWDPLGTGPGILATSLEKVAAGEFLLLPLGGYLAAGLGRAVCAFDESSGWRRVLNLPGSKRLRVNALKWCRQVRKLALACSDNHVLIWSEKDGLERMPGRNDGGHTDQVTSLGVSADGSILASGSRDNSVRFWDLHARIEIGKILGHDDWIMTLAMTDNAILTGSADRTIREWHFGGGHHSRIKWRSIPGEHYSIPALEYAEALSRRLFPEGLEESFIKRYALWNVDLDPPIDETDFDDTVLHDKLGHQSH